MTTHDMLYWCFFIDNDGSFIDSPWHFRDFKGFHTNIIIIPFAGGAKPEKGSRTTSIEHKRYQVFNTYSMIAQRVRVRRRSESASPQVGLAPRGGRRRPRRHAASEPSAGAEAGETAEMLRTSTGVREMNTHPACVQCRTPPIPPNVNVHRHAQGECNRSVK